MAAVLLLAGCKEKDWCKMVEEREDAFMEYFFSLEEEGKSSDEISQQVDSCYAALQKDVEAIATKGLRKHNDDSVAFFLVKEMYDLEILDNDGLLKAIQALGPNAQADPVIVKLKTNVEKVMETGEGTHFLDFSVELYGIQGIPHIMLIGPDGTISSATSPVRT